ncbi:hypothetical protein [Streptomyces candidus]|uniref:Uncharacterized protein n=1 Tax=Streptomyces candidus TaxID=67283 RepID=A0A7X0HKW6_9ACTN|nr:hypothetical protein [Streptomyces candidus]MBB6439368.1 hypothetical protein [Streptomyces candidus]GHH44207.1 hypothetical protein GCM10018773_31440 [Streptomyces candidus]
MRAEEAGNSDEHLCGYLHALTNLALRFVRVGRDAEVSAPALEAADLVVQLPDTEMHPRNALPGLVESLTWLGHHLDGQGRRREGRTVARAAQDLRRRMR